MSRQSFVENRRNWLTSSPCRDPYWSGPGLVAGACHKFEPNVARLVESTTELRHNYQCLEIQIRNAFTNNLSIEATLEQLETVLTQLQREPSIIIYPDIFSLFLERSTCVIDREINNFSSNFQKHPYGHQLTKTLRQITNIVAKMVVKKDANI
ncbi:hypothetical protein TNCV_2227921 [Trichonephila clavipes]|nr:hypothetical protein TNCV_2227921 [Trichonephila clavipes]